MANRFYQGKFQPRFPKKYRGDPTNIVYRSSWELAAFKWLDENDQVVSYASEELVIPYVLLKEDGTQKLHRYFPDLDVQFANGQRVIIEIKPASQTKMPVMKKKGRASKYAAELQTFKKNVAKWKAAMEYCKLNNMVFRVWTEKTLYELTGFKA